MLFWFGRAVGADFCSLVVGASLKREVGSERILDDVLSKPLYFHFVPR